MSDNNNANKKEPSISAVDPPNRAPTSAARLDENKTAQLRQAQIDLYEIDKTKGVEAQKLMNEYTMLVASSYHSPAKNSKGETAAQVYEKWQKLSAEIGKDKKAIEDKIAAILTPPELSPEAVKKFQDERAKRANAAAQETPVDLSAFANPELDKIRSQLQNEPLKGGPAASVDDGTGGEGNNTEETQPAPTAPASAAAATADKK